jgi:phosphatidylinositol alpha-1,6-mannosyltransferase
MCKVHRSIFARGTGRVLILSPSRGLGGGIERYADTLEWVFGSELLKVKRIDLKSAAHVNRTVTMTRMYARCEADLRENNVPIYIVVMHRSLLPLAWMLAKRYSVCGISVVCHGNEVWGSRPFLRRCTESRLLKSQAVRAVAVSSYTAGALAGVCSAAILSPGLSKDWFNTLVNASMGCRPSKDRLEIVTAFRLAQWRDKGLPQLIEAVAALGRPENRVTICGTGSPPPDLLRLLGKHSWCSLLTDLPASDLARKFAEADLMVLATQARSGSDAFCESYGLVLVEAQVAGTAVVAPAFGGSRDTFVAHLTGVAPSSQTPEELSCVLAELARDRDRLEQMGVEAAKWAREEFLPERYACRAVSALL